MKKSILFLIFILLFSWVWAQDYSDYQPSATMINDLEHVKIKANFDIPNEKMFGEVWLTLTPHFYPTDSLTLDAKGMDILEVFLENGRKLENLKYSYSNNKLKIQLNKTYVKGNLYTVYIKYIAIPKRVTQQGSASITKAQGLYFINPRQEDPYKPTQIWTQGETQSTSCWVPIIDETNQKTSQEIYMTVPSNFVTLSNGSLVSQSNQDNGTRTDYWKFDKKHAPYLFFMGAGNFSIVKDQWKNIPVTYYVEKEYEPYAKEIFGNTPEMMQFFSNILNFPYPWEKYAQMVGRDYISGAMENTTATLHMEDAQQKPGQLIDENIWESVIAHELFHHWFGDLATAESWANLTVNESFANYSEYLWLEYKYGKDKAEEHKDTDKEGYLQSGSDFEKDLVRFQYKDREDVFDAVTYNKGGLILHMLRKYLGDQAFFAGLNKYLTDNQYKATEAHNLRLALEAVSGKDLNWFFNQWFFGNGHPKLKVQYIFDEKNKKIKIDLLQTQDPKFQFPIDIDIYENGKKRREKFWAKARELNSFEVPYNKKPELININPENILLAEITDDKTIDQYIFQYKNAEEYSSKKIALAKLSDAQTSNPKALETLLEAAEKDKFEGLRIFAISELDETNPKVKEKSANILEKIARSDVKTLAQAEAIKKLAKIDSKKYAPLFKKMVSSPSYAIKSASIEGLLDSDPKQALIAANTITDARPGKLLSSTIAKVGITNNDDSKLNLISNNLLNLLINAQSQEEADSYFKVIRKIMEGDYPTETYNLIEPIIKIYPQAKKYSFSKVLLEIVEGSLTMKQGAYAKTPNESLKKQVNYIKEKLDSIK